MDSYQKLIKDTIKYVKVNSAFYYDDTFSIQTNFNPKFLLPKKNYHINNSIKPQKKILEKPETEIPIKNESKATAITTAKPKQTFLDKDNKILPNADQFKDVYQLITKIDPGFQLSYEILEDTTAKKVANRWKYRLNAYPITILTSLKDEEELKFLRSIAKAIEIYFYDAKVVLIDSIEKENLWDEFLNSDNIRLLIAVDDQIWHFKNLMTYYKEIPNQSLKQLGKIPLFLIPNLKLYFRNFILKKSLWKALCKTISNL